MAAPARAAARPGPKRRWATTAALLREVGLPAEASAQYAAALEREALEPQTLAEVLAQRGSLRSRRR